MSPEKVEPLVAIMLRRGGFVKTHRALLFLAQYGIAREDTGHEIGVGDVSRWWKQPRATTYRNRDAFRLCLGHDLEPEEVWQKCKAVQRLRIEKRDTKKLMSQLYGVQVSL